MTAFLDDIKQFRGTGDKNEKGQYLREFLEDYDAQKYENPSVTADVLLFQHGRILHSVDKGLKLLMIQRRDHPCIGNWALPGGFVEMNEDLMDTAKRELQEETNLTGIPLEQLYTWGEYKRDPRTRIITTSFLGLVDDKVGQIKAGDDAKDAVWMDVIISRIGMGEMEKDGKIKVRMIYEISLSNQEKKVSISARVAVTKNKDSILEETTYQELDSKGIAFDHSKFIVQALLRLKHLVG